MIRHLKIRDKISLSIILIGTIALLIIGMVSYLYFANLAEKNARNDAEYTLTVASEYWETQFNSTLTSVARFFSDPKMVQTIVHTVHDKDTHYINDYIRIESGFNTIIQSNDYISGAFMIDKKNHFYSKADIGMNYNPDIISSMNLETIEGITFLPSQQSPLRTRRQVLPLIIPIRYAEKANLIFVSNDINDVTAYMIILFDTKKINQYLTQINNVEGAILYLSDQQGLTLSVPKEALDSVMKNSDIIQHLKTKEEYISIKETIANDTFMLFSRNIHIRNIRLVSIISRNDLLRNISSLRLFIITSCGLCALGSLITSFYVSNKITKPIYKQMEIIQMMEKGEYHETISFETVDEIGILNHRINDMHEVIQQQIDTIKEEEQANAQAEINLLASQINPHFLYNTLECIHFEILCHHTEEASTMLESLGQFLRIGLNRGDSLIPISQELKHVTEYVAIMNHRSNKKINFQVECPEELNTYRVLKLLLQPLVENSFRHGFIEDNLHSTIFFPTILVRVTLEDAFLTLEVIDNGVGIPLEQARKALYHLEDEKKIGHIGLNNIYRRIRAHYGEKADIQLFSIPYVQNIVTIILPV